MGENKLELVFDDIIRDDQLHALVQIHCEEQEKELMEEINRDKTMIELELEADIYCAGFLTVLRSDSPK